MAEAKTPGLSIAIIRDAKVLWRRGFGVRDSAAKEPVDNDTVFEAASVSGSCAIKVQEHDKTRV